MKRKAQLPPEKADNSDDKNNHQEEEHSVEDLGEADGNSDNDGEEGEPDGSDDQDNQQQDDDVEVGLGQEGERGGDDDDDDDDERGEGEESTGDNGAESENEEGAGGGNEDVSRRDHSGEEKQEDNTKIAKGRTNHSGADKSNNSSNKQEQEDGGDENDFDDDFDDDDDDDEKDGTQSEDEIDVDFEFDEPKELDFHSIKNMMERYIGQENNFNPSEMVDIILSQKNITKVIRVDGSEELFGFASVVDFHKHSNLATFLQIKQYILQKACDKTSLFRNVFAERHRPLGLILSERMINLPPQLAFPINNALFQNIKNVADDQENQFNFERYLILTRFQKNMGEENEGKKRKKGKKVEKSDQQDFYSKIEDEIFQQQADLAFTFNIMHGEFVSRWTLNGNMSTVGLAMVVRKEKIPILLQQLEKIAE